MFEKDISNLAKPEIKGRGFVQSGNDIIETQTYFTRPEYDWVFDETQRMTYDNPVFTEQKAIRKETIDDSGFIPQHRLDDTTVDVSEEQLESLLDENSDEPSDNDELFNVDTSEDGIQTIGFKFDNGKTASVRAALEAELDELDDTTTTQPSSQTLKLNINSKPTVKFKL